jgi:hypothetical protein
MRRRVLQAQQHSKHPLQLTIQMDLVTAEPLQLVGVEGLVGPRMCDPTQPTSEPRTYYWWWRDKS